MSSQQQSVVAPRLLQAMDPHSGTVFDKIFQANAGEVSTADISNYLGDPELSFRFVPQGGRDTGRGTSASRPGSSKPTVTLTLPTPLLASSPVFVPQSPITVSKFFLASAMTARNPTDAPGEQQLIPDRCSPSGSGSGPTPLPPSLTSCGQCGLFAFDQGEQCRACDERWLACKVWYRAHDGGRRKWLTEPYIHPGECNETNREMMRDLGLVVCAEGKEEPSWDRAGYGSDPSASKSGNNPYWRSAKTKLAGLDLTRYPRKRMNIPGSMIRKAAVRLAKVQFLRSVQNILVGHTEQAGQYVRYWPGFSY